MSKEKRASVHFDRKTLSFIGLDDAVKRQLADTYKGVDIEKELKKMALWLQTSKGKTYKATLGFILTWLGKASPTLKGSDPGLIAAPDTPLGILFNEYLEELWKPHEHLLQLNTLKA